MIKKCCLEEILLPINNIEDCTITSLSIIYKKILVSLPSEYVSIPLNDLERVSNVQAMIDIIAEDLEVDLRDRLEQIENFLPKNR